MIQQLKITFFLYTYKTNSKGEAPIYCKINLLDKKKHFSSGVYIIPSQWDKDSQRAKGIEDDVQLINRKLQEIYSQLVRLEKQLYDEGEAINLNSIYDRYRGKEVQHTLLSLYKDRLSIMMALVGKEYTLSTIKKFNEVCTHVQQFVKHHYRLDDILLKQVDFSFIKAFEEYLLERGLKPITINKIIQRLKQITNYAFRCNLMLKDPFVNYKPLKEKKELVFLTAEELEKLEKFDFANHKLEKVKDLYLFSVYSGLAYHEVCELRKQHLTKGFDSKTWIKMTRQKTGREFFIPLLPQAESILKKYEDCLDGSEGNLLPIISNAKINVFLKEIAAIVGIEKNLTHHTARKTFASTILLYNDVPMEIVSVLLGHANIGVTQKSYAQVVNKSISRHMNQLEEKLFRKE